MYVLNHDDPILHNLIWAMVYYCQSFHLIQVAQNRRTNSTAEKVGVNVLILKLRFRHRHADFQRKC